MFSRSNFLPVGLFLLRTFFSLALRTILDPILVKLVEQFRLEHPGEYALRVMLWENLRAAGIVIPGFTTDVKCASYPFGMTVLTTSVTKPHLDKLDTNSLGIDLSVGRCDCHSGGLELSGVNNSIAVFNPTEACAINFRRFKHTYQAIDEDQAAIVCERCNLGSCTTSGVPTYDQHAPPTQESRKTLRVAILLTDHEEDTAWSSDRPTGYKTWIDRYSSNLELLTRYVCVWMLGGGV